MQLWAELWPRWLLHVNGDRRGIDFAQEAHAMNLHGIAATARAEIHAGLQAMEDECFAVWEAGGA